MDPTPQRDSEQNQENATPTNSSEPAENTSSSPAVASSEAPAETEPTSPSQTVVSSDDTTASVVSPTPSPAVVGGRKKPGRKLFALIALVVIILLVAGFAFAFYLPNTPGRVYSSSLTNTGKALDKLVDYVQTEDKASYKSASFDGTMKLKSSSVSFDSTLTGAFDKNSNGKLQLKADVEGENITANVVSVKAAGNTSPDLYFQVSGVKNYLDSAGLNDLDSLDGQWISVDHTLLDTYAASLKSSLGSGSNVADATSVPTVEQLNDAITKVQTVNKQYLFTTDDSKAVLTDQKFIAKETKNGHTQNHYKVGYDKAHLQSYVAALKTALDSSKLNDWSKKANDGKNLSEELDFKSLEASIKNAKSDYTFDLWADTKTKLVSSLQFTDPKDNSKLTIGQNYTGGTTYPLSLEVSDSPDSNGKFNLSVDTKTHKYVLDFTTTPGTKAKDGATVTGNFTITPSNDSVSATAPSGAKSINDVLNQLGLGGLLDSAAADQTDSASLDDNSVFTLTQ
jgi:hypothetical protein